MFAQPDQELRLSGSWLLAVTVLIAAQIALVGLAMTGLAMLEFALIFAILQANVLWVAYGLINPPKRLFFNGKRLLVCDQNGRKKACIKRPEGFASPFFIGLRLGRWRSLGIVCWQMKPEEFGHLLRWMRQTAPKNRV